MNVDIDGVIQRDHVLQYLAFYTATKGLLVTTDPETIHNCFVEYKQMVKRKECSLSWLVNSVITKYGTPVETPPSAKESNLPPNMVVVPEDVMDALVANFMQSTGQQPPTMRLRKSDQPPSLSDKTVVDTLPTEDPLVGLQNLLNHLRQKLQDSKKNPNPPLFYPPKNKKNPKKKKNDTHLSSEL